MLRSVLALLLGLAGAGLYARVPNPVPPFAAAAETASPTISNLLHDVRAGHVDAVPAFWARIERLGAPLVEATDSGSSLVTFVWRGSAATRNVVVVDGVAVAVGGVNPVDSEMTNVPGTDLWYRTYKVRNDARFVYKLSENDSLQSFVDPNRSSPHVVADPLNPHLFPTGQSYVELPDAPVQTLATRAAPRAGVVTQETFHSDLLRNDRRVWVYTPPGFKMTAGRYPLVIVFDGVGYTQWVPVPRILDNLIADRRIAPTVAVMLGGAASDRDEICSSRFADFVATELVPWMQRQYRATADARRTVIGGSSLGALTATCAALRHPEVFRNVLSQSGSYWWAPMGDPSAEWVKHRVAESARLPLRFYLEVGQMEIPDQQQSNHALRDVLRAKGYRVNYHEFNGNHTYLQWRGSFGAALESLTSGGS